MNMFTEPHVGLFYIVVLIKQIHFAILLCMQKRREN